MDAHQCWVVYLVRQMYGLDTLTMTNDDVLTLLDDSHLMDLAGQPAFVRGAEYFVNGHVGRWNREGNIITAEVIGVEVYQVTLELTRKALNGACSCPASEGIVFCKHCVATALAVRTELCGVESAEAADVGDESELVRNYLQRLDKVTLEEALLEMIESDDAQLQRWTARAEALFGQADHKKMKKRITAAFPYNANLYRFDAVDAYFSRAEPTIDMLVEQAPMFSAEHGLALVDYALLRLSRALEAIDDSGGFRFYCEQTLQQLHIQAVGRLEWSAEKKADYLYALAFGDQQDWYPGIPEAYYQALGDDGLSAYIRLLQKQWDALPSLKQDAGWKHGLLYDQLRGPLLDQAKRRDDLPAMLALYQKTASRERDCIGAAELCIEYDAWDQLELWLARAASAESSHGSRWSTERERLRVRLLQHQNKAQAAAELQLTIYQSTHQLGDYHLLLEMAGEHQLDTDYRQQVIDWHTTEITQRSGSSPSRYGLVSPVNSLLEIYLSEQNLDEALALCREHRAAPHLLLNLARALKDRPQDSLPIYVRLARHDIEQTKNHSYKQAIKLLKELKKTLTTAQHQQDFTSAVNQLRVDYGKKRNFIKWLNEAFGDA